MTGAPNRGVHVLLLFTAAAALALLGVLLAQQPVPFDGRGVRTDATVIQTDLIDETAYTTVTYTDLNGATVEAVTPYVTGAPVADSTVVIMFDPANPGDVLQDGYTPPVPMAAAIVLTAATATGVAATALMIRAAVHRHRTRRLSHRAAAPGPAPAPGPDSTSVTHPTPTEGASC